MSNWWVHSYVQAGLVTLLISHIFWVIFSIVLHELAHGWAALWQGDDTPRRLERLTMNPLVHMGGWSLLMFAIMGIAWGVMPVTPSRFRWGRRGRAVVAAAGPAMNVALLLVCVLGLVLVIRLVDPASAAFEHILTFFFAGAVLNVVLALFNLLPIPPLDGSSILSGLSLRFYVWFQDPRAPMIGLFIVLAIIVSGVGGFIWVGGAMVTRLLVDLGGALVGNPRLEEVFWAPF